MKVFHRVVIELGSKAPYEVAYFFINIEDLKLPVRMQVLLQHLEVLEAIG